MFSANHNHFFRSRSKLLKFSLKIFSQFPHITSHSLDQFIIWSHNGARLKEDPRDFVQFEAAWSKNSSMVKSKFCGIVLNWTSRPLPINSTSLLEEDLIIARSEFVQIQSCSSRGHEIVSLISQFFYAILVDLFLVIMLSFDSLKSMQYSLRFDDLKFGW